MIYAIPYISLVVFYGCLSVYSYYTTKKTTRTYIDVICILVFVLFFGLRGFVFYDWTNYYPTFYCLTDFKGLFSTSILKWDFEPGFMILATTCKSILNDFQFFVLVCCLIDVWLLVKFLKRYISNLPLGLVLYICMGGLVLSTDLMRNSITILLFANALHYIQERDPIKYFTICLIGISFHISGIVYLPMYFILNRKFNKLILLGVFVAANLVYLLHISIVMNLISLVLDFVAPSTKLWLQVYTEMDANIGSVLSIGYVERLITGILVFCYMDKLQAKRKGSNIFINSILIYLFVFLFFSEFRTICMRSSNLFIYSYWIVWIDLLGCFYIKNNKILFAIFIGIYCILKTYGNCDSALAEYENVLFGTSSYTERLIHFRQHYDDK